MGFIVGGFILRTVRNAILLIAVVVLFIIVAALFTWNTCYGRRFVVGFIARYPNVELRTTKDGQYVKVSGVLACGNVPLESAFQKVPRCVYTCTSLYEVGIQKQPILRIDDSLGLGHQIGMWWISTYPISIWIKSADKDREWSKGDPLCG